jgi:glycosyltransferase involved in cell wall biosynthesis
MKKQKEKQISKKSQIPLVSVVIPVFNGATYLREAVESVLKSTYKKYEIILVDDGSTDESKRICKQLVRQSKKIHFYSIVKNRGLGRTLNYALKKARGKYIARLNQDDIMLKNRLKTQVDYLESHPEIVALGSFIKYFSDSQEVITFIEKDQDIRKMWHIVSPFADPSVMFVKAIALKVGGYDQAMWPADDTHLWIRMGQEGQLANLQKVLVKVRWHKSMASVKYFRTLAISTYKMHLWVDERINSAPLWVHLYWMVQLAAGLLISPQINWNVYRFLKKLFYFQSLVSGKVSFFLKKIIKLKLPKMLKSHPMILKSSGE